MDMSRLGRQLHVEAPLSPAEFERDVAETLEITPMSVLAAVKRIAEFDPGEAYNEDGTLKALQDMPREVRQCIASIETEEIWDGVGPLRRQIGVTRKVRFRDGDRMLELLGKHLGLFARVVKHEVSDDFATLLRMAREGREREARMRRALTTEATEATLLTSVEATDPGAIPPPATAPGATAPDTPLETTL